MAWQKAVGISTRELELWICEECLCQFCMNPEKMVSIIRRKLNCVKRRENYLKLRWNSTKMNA